MLRTRQKVILTLGYVTRAGYIVVKHVIFIYLRISLFLVSREAIYRRTVSVS
jgi:hypothetical protein